MAGGIRNEEGRVREVEDGGPAFPGKAIRLELRGMGYKPDRNVTYDVPGVSARDFFAAHALTGILAAITERWHANDWLKEAKEQNMTTAQLVAISAYERADAMLEARKE